MTGCSMPAPGDATLKAGQKRAGDAGGVASAAPDFTIAAPPGLRQYRCPRLVTWLRCHVCHRGYFAAGAPGPQPCPACAGGRLQPVALWDLRTEAAPPGLLRLTSDVLVRGGVVR